MLRHIILLKKQKVHFKFGLASLLFLCLCVHLLDGSGVSTTWVARVKELGAKNGAMRNIRSIINLGGGGGGQPHKPPPPWLCLWQ